MPAAQTTRESTQRLVAGFTVTEWPGNGPAAFCLSGLGSFAPTWGPFATSLPDAHLFGIDLRGRGDGQGMAGPTGLRQHAMDVAAVLAELDLTDLVLIGHSMGAYLAPVVAQEAKGRIRKLVLVDGGIRPRFPFFMGPALTRLMFARQLKGADRSFPTVQALADKARIGAMLKDRPDLLPSLMQILEAEAGGTAGGYRPRLDVGRAVADAVDTFFGPDIEPALAALTVPAQVFLAENAKKAGQKPFISDKAVAPAVARQPLLDVHRLPGNHVTVLFAPEVAAAVRT
jgi:pimeloyl-ACP methyl ester carboxylesterase